MLEKLKKANRILYVIEVILFLIAFLTLFLMSLGPVAFPMSQLIPVVLIINIFFITLGIVYFAPAAIIAIIRFFIVLKIVKTDPKEPFLKNLILPFKK